MRSFVIFAFSSLKIFFFVSYIKSYQNFRRQYLDRKPFHPALQSGIIYEKCFDVFQLLKMFGLCKDFGYQIIFFEHFTNFLFFSSNKIDSVVQHFDLVAINNKSDISLINNFKKPNADNIQDIYYYILEKQKEQKKAYKNGDNKQFITIFYKQSLIQII